MLRPGFMSFTLPIVLLPAACASQAPPPAAVAPAPDAPAESRTVEETPLTWFIGKTHLSYDDSHGNQIWYQDSSGRYFLWYPSNRGVVTGQARVEGPERLCFRSDDEDVYNPATGLFSEWECFSVPGLRSVLVDSVPGDVFDLATGRVPFRLPAHPRYNSVADVNAPR